MSKMRSITFVTVVAVLAIATPSFAGDVLIFKNGTHLAVDSHEMVDDMIYVAIDDGEMAFPADMVERVERGESSALAASAARSGNRMVAGVERSAGGAAAARARSRESDLDPSLAGAVEEDASGTKSYRPLARSAGANRRGLAVTGSQRVIGAPQVERASDAELLGATRMGDRNVIGAIGPRRRPGEQPKPVVVGLEARDGGPLEATPSGGVLAPPEAPADGGSGGSRTDRSD